MKSASSVDFGNSNSTPPALYSVLNGYRVDVVTNKTFLFDCDAKYDIVSYTTPDRSRLFIKDIKDGIDIIFTKYYLINIIINISVKKKLQSLIGAF
jgi:hypothetical protein